MDTSPNWNPKAILFDLDGTLINTDDVAVRHLAQKLEPILGDKALVAARKMWMAAETPGNAFITFLDWLGLDDELFAIKKSLSQWHNPDVEPTFELMEGVKPMLHALSQKFVLGIVTTRGTYVIEQFLRQNPDLVDLFAVTVGADSTDRLKPHPDPILLAARELGLLPKQCVMVGDTPVDMKSAKRAGAWRVGVLCGFGEAHELHRAGANMILECTAETPDLFL